MLGSEERDDDEVDEENIAVEVAFRPGKACSNSTFPGTRREDVLICQACVFR